MVDLQGMGERQVVVDCDVIQADGGTRTASITGAYVALSDAFQTLIDRGELSASPMREAVAAVSVGIVDGVPFLDLDYPEDSGAEVDMNFVMTSSMRFVEVQGTAEAEPFTLEQMDAMRGHAMLGLSRLFEIQIEALQA